MLALGNAHTLYIAKDLWFFCYFFFVSFLICLRTTFTNHSGSIGGVGESYWLVWVSSPPPHNGLHKGVKIPNVECWADRSNSLSAAGRNLVCSGEEILTKMGCGTWFHLTYCSEQLRWPIETFWLCKYVEEFVFSLSWTRAVNINWWSALLQRTSVLSFKATRNSV